MKLCLILLFCCQIFQIAQAGVIADVTVDTVADEVSVNATTSLREAIALAPVGSPWTICFDPSLSGKRIILGLGALALTNKQIVTIDAGNLERPVTIDGNDAPILVGTSASLSLKNLALTNGPADFAMVAISLTGSVFFAEDCQFSRCANLMYFDTTFNDDDCQFTRCHFFNIDGFIDIVDGSLSFVDCSIHHCAPVFQLVTVSDGDLLVRNCTIARNSGSFARLLDSGGVFEHSTLAGNGGATSLVSLQSSSTLTLSHCVLDNFDSFSTFPTGITSLGWNYSSGTESFLNHPNDELEIDPELSPLGYFGSSRPVCMPRPGSPLIDAGNPAIVGAPVSDQRGFGRIVDGDLLAAIAIDIGAVEAGNAYVVTNSADSGAGSLRDVMSSSPDGSRVVFDGSLSGSIINITTSPLTGGMKHIDVDASNLATAPTINGSGAASRVLQVNAGESVSFSSVRFRGVNNVSQAGSIQIAGGSAGFTDTIFWENGATFGGALDVGLKGSLLLNGCEFLENTATVSGGALQIGGSTTVDIWNCAFVANSGGSDAGAILANNSGGDLRLRNCTFTQNISGGDGGAIHAGALSAVYGEFLTFVHNRADNDGGAVSVQDGSFLVNFTLSSCLFTGNQAGAAETVDLSSSFPEGRVLGSLASAAESAVALTGSNIAGEIIDLAPLGFYGGKTRCMPPIGQTLKLALRLERIREVVSDQRGYPREELRMIGAVGYPRTALVTTLNDVSGIGDTTLRQALASTPAGGIILFESSLSGGTISTIGELTIPRDLIIDATEIPRGIRLDAGGTHRVLAVPIGVNAGLHGLSFYNGSNTAQNGGGVRAFGNTNVSHAAFVACSAAFGGGLWAGDGSNYVFVVLENCTFTGNTSSASGSGFGGNLAFVEARHCTIYQNNGTTGVNIPGHTAGTYFAGASTVLRAGNCVVSDNLRRNGTILNFFFQGASFQDLGFNLSTSGPGLGAFQNWGGLAWGHRPEAMGLCENAGDPNILILPARDQLGAPRVEDGRVDIGAIEFGQCTFQQRYPGLTAFDDEDGDGWTNIEEYAYRLDPYNEDSLDEPAFYFTDLRDDARREQWVTFFRNPKATDINIRVEQSFNLETWAQVPYEVRNGVLVNSRGVIPHEDPEVTAVIEDYNSTEAYMRLKVSQ